MQTTRLHAGLGSPSHMKSLQPAKCSRSRCASKRKLPAAASQDSEPVRKAQPGDGSKDRRGGLGDLLGPIGLTLGGKLKQEKSEPDTTARREQRDGADPASESRNGSGNRSNGSNGSGNGVRSGVELGPIALSFAEDQNDRSGDEAMSSGEAQEMLQSIHSMTTEEWRRQYEQDGAVDLWVEEEFNSGSRLMGGRDTYRGLEPGFGSGEGPSSGTAASHIVRILNPAAGQEVEVEVPEDRYILWEAEEQGLLLPWACRMGCCTACAVKVLEGEVHQPQALGVSKGLRDQGYALMCISYPRSDAVLQCVEEDELYDMQFGEAFAAQALDPNDKRNVLRDDYALEIADMDE